MDHVALRGRFDRLKALSVAEGERRDATAIILEPSKTGDTNCTNYHESIPVALPGRFDRLKALSVAEE